jgi:hypothetical protein
MAATDVPCKCCQDKKPGATGGNNGYGFNRLDGTDWVWAKDHGFFVSERCVSVKGSKRFKGPLWQKIKCGDGSMGFSTRRKGHEEVHLERGLDGQWKKKRGSMVRPRSARASASRHARRVDGSKCGLVSSVCLDDASRDPLVVESERIVHKKSVRAHNRNNGARRGHKLAMKMAA